MPPTHFEDFEPGQVYELGGQTVTAEEIVAFARQYDPQPFHVDEEAAKASPFGGLIASGWHTAMLVMRLYVEAILVGAAGMGSPGFDELRWLVPVRPGDTIRGRATVLEATPSATHPGRGTVTMRFEALNQDDAVVMRFVARLYFARRQSGPNEST